jgi:hypothetical protein
MTWAGMRVASTAERKGSSKAGWKGGNWVGLRACLLAAWRAATTAVHWAGLKDLLKAGR